MTFKTGYYKEMQKQAVYNDAWKKQLNQEGSKRGMSTMESYYSNTPAAQKPFQYGGKGVGSGTIKGGLNLSTEAFGKNKNNMFKNIGTGITDKANNIF